MKKICLRYQKISVAALKETENTLRRIFSSISVFQNFIQSCPMVNSKLPKKASPQGYVYN